MGPGGPRMDKLRDKLKAQSLDALLITSESNWRYLSGFRGDSGALLLTLDAAFVFTDSRYIEQARKEASGFTTIMTQIDRDRLKEIIEEQGIKRLAFEKDHVTYAAYEKYQERFKDIELVGISGWVEELRLRKTEEEIQYIKKAQEIADVAFLRIKESVRPGITEKELSLEFEFDMRKMGAESLSFPMIVVAGPRSSLPHGTPSDRRVEDGDFITFDFGVKYNGYCSDCTRTLVVGHLDKKHEEVYRTVLSAQLKGLDAVKPGVPAREVDLAARKVIEEAGYGEYFGHGTGHGVGLDIHEGPIVGKKSEILLEPGMVITVEPGIYIPGFGGCRIEDLVLVTDSGKEILSKTSKELSIV
jgi:Xaa-Pro aminopeptidase